MKKDKWLLIGSASLLITAFLLAAIWYKRSERQESGAKVTANSDRLVRSYSPFLGPADAPVTIVEFLDPECEACRALYPMVKEAMKPYGGKVRLVIRYMPLHGNAAYAAGMLEAARKQDKYWEALETLFEHQPEWGSHHAPKPEMIPVYLKALGLDMEKLTASSKDSEIVNRVRQDHEDGTQLGVSRTPTFFVNGKMLEHLGVAEFRQAIDAELR